MEKIILELLINKEAIVLFFILLFLILLIVIILNSKLQITIENLDISTERKEKIKKDFEIYFEIIIFNKIKIFKINAKRFKNKKLDFNEIIEKAKKISKKSSEKELAISSIKSLKDLQIVIIKANLNISLGTEDAATTAISVGVLASILGIILKKQKFEIMPIYQNKNILNIKLNCIFRIDLIHYIYKTILKGRDKNERQSSNRRAYANSNG